MFGSFCESCPYSGKNVRVGCVPPLIRGSKLLIIGEAPGKTEAALKEPFVGRSGRLLRAELAKHGVKDYSVTNVVLCRPPENETPKKEAQRACRPNLDWVIKKVNPKIVLVLGATAIEAVEGIKQSLESRRGKVQSVLYKTQSWTDYPGYLELKVSATFHPAYILRYPNLISQWGMDITRTIHAIYSIEVEGNYDYLLIDDLDKLSWLSKMLEQEDSFGVDIETTGLDIVSDSIIGVSISWRDRQGIYLPTTKEAWPNDEWLSVIEKFLKSDKEKIFHHGKFDCGFFEKIGIRVNNFSFDTMAAHHLLYEDLPHRLESVAADFCPDKAGYKNKLQSLVGVGKYKKESYSTVPLDVMTDYACGDADSTRRLLGVFKPKLEKEGLLDFFQNHVMPLQTIARRMETHGINFDADWCAKASKELIGETEERIAKIRELCGKDDLNVRSVKQVAPHLFDGFDPVKWTPKGEASTDKEALQMLAEQGNEIAPLLLEFRMYDKLRSAYANSIPTFVRADGRVHPSIKTTGAATGRWSVKDPAIQTIPRKASLRGIFIATEGWKLIEYDFSQLELRLLAILSQDKTMIREYQEKRDLHAAMGALIFNKPIDQVSKAERQIGKGVNFSAGYGGGPIAVALSINKQRSSTEPRIMPEEVEPFIKTFFSKYQGVYVWSKKVVTELKKNGQVRNMFGRVRRLPAIYSDYYSDQLDTERQAVNFLVQGLAADFTHDRLLAVVDFLDKEGLRACPIMEIHDALYFDCPEDEVAQVAPEIKKIMEKFPFEVPVAMEVDQKISTRWYNEDKDPYFKD